MGQCNYVLSVKIQEPQFAGQTKQRLSSRQCAPFVSGVIKVLSAYGFTVT